MSRRRQLPIVRYNNFLKAARRSQGLGHKQAQGFYRGLKARVERVPTVRDLREHPRISRQVARAILKPAPVAKPSHGPVAVAAAPGPLAPAATAARREVGGAPMIADEGYDDFVDYDDFIEGDEDVYEEIA